MLGRSKVRLLAMLAAAIAAFSVVGFAASFTINENQRMVNAEGETLVVSCDNDITVWKLDKWLDPVEGGPGAGGFYVKMIQLRNVDAACAGNYFAIVITGPDGKKIVASPWMQYTSGNVNWTPAINVPVANVRDIHVAVAGNVQDPIN